MHQQNEAPQSKADSVAPVAPAATTIIPSVKQTIEERMSAFEKSTLAGPGLKGSISSRIGPFCFGFDLPGKSKGSTGILSSPCGWYFQLWPTTVLRAGGVREG